jgi:hypothetical protein
MMRMMFGMRDRVKSRIGVYGTGFNPESVIGLLLPFIVVGIMALIGWLFVVTLNS